MLNLPTLSTAALIATTLLAGCAHQPPQTHEPSNADPLVLSLPYFDVDGERHRAVVTGPNPPTTEAVTPDIYSDELPSVEVIRTGRYQLVATQASLGQRYLLEQTIDVRIPASMTTTVEDALHHTLRHTGYSLCPAPGPAQRTLYRKPLPAAHYRLGPMPLREALQVLGGDAWELEVDPVAREVCYQVRDIRYAPGHGDDSREERNEAVAEVSDE
ncbi:pilus assembly protein PilL [Halomonas alkalicola]|uniref:PFGI-1 class ICE element type IV pilus protein PilL2 n=1 Tax=Halomonas alkalicola TaxID=1930622 RepID=UPI0035F0D569